MFLWAVLKPYHIDGEAPCRSSIGLSHVFSACEPSFVHTSIEKLGFIQHLPVNNKDVLLLHGLLPCPGKGLGSVNETMSHAVLRLPKMEGSQRRVLRKCDPLEEEMANHPSILAERT